MPARNRLMVRAWTKFVLAVFEIGRAIIFGGAPKDRFVVSAPQ